MNLSFDPTVPAEVAVVQRMLDGLSGNKTIEIKLDQRMVDKLPPVGEMLPGTAKADYIPPAPPTAQQCDSMDDTGGIRHPSSAVFEPIGRAVAERISQGADPLSSPAPSTAAAPPSPNAPEAPQDGAAIDPSVFGQSAAPGPVPPVPTAPVAPMSPAADDDVPVLDKRGLPWDERIHASTKATNADGTWRARRNMTDDQKAAVPGIEAELLARVGRESVAAEDTAQRAGVVITGQSGVTTESSDFVSAAPAVSAPPLPPAAPVAPPVPSLPAIPSSTPPAAAPAPAAATASGEPMVGEGDFVALFGKVTKLLSGGLLGEQDVHKINERLGLLPAATGMMLLPTRPDLVLQYDAAVEELFA